MRKKMIQPDTAPAPSVNIVGAGLSGLSAAVTLAGAGLAVNLISTMPSERAQSVMAEGGINAALDTMGEGDTTEEHFRDTMKGGCYLEDESAVRRLTGHAPEVVRDMARLGVPFQQKDGKLILRNFGGQKKKRTAYARSSTGKMLMTALIDEARRYEGKGLIRRYARHLLTGLRIAENSTGRRLAGIEVLDMHTREQLYFPGISILCTGGMNGFFEGMTTGTVPNTGDAAAIAFSAGVRFANLEFIQYHPTTVQIPDKRMLISEAARGEGGRLYVERGGKPWYFMEERFPELGNLSPRDVVSREMYRVVREDGCGDTVYLDMTGLPQDTWERKLPDLRDEIRSYLGIDPKESPVPVSPGIHFFMGGIRVDDGHRTNITDLYAAGEAACKYHGANRLGGNSLLGAIYGGRAAAESILEGIAKSAAVPEPFTGEAASESDPAVREELKDILLSGLGIVRTEGEMLHALGRLAELQEKKELSEIDRKRLLLGQAMLESALHRRESRGAHFREDYPKTEEAFAKATTAEMRDGRLMIGGESGEML